MRERVFALAPRLSVWQNESETVCILAIPRKTSKYLNSCTSAFTYIHTYVQWQRKQIPRYECVCVHVRVYAWQAEGTTKSAKTNDERADKKIAQSVTWGTLHTLTHTDTRSPTHSPTQTHSHLHRHPHLSTQVHRYFVFKHFQNLFLLNFVVVFVAKLIDLI